jgi:hypothetical protein
MTDKLQLHTAQQGKALIKAAQQKCIADLKAQAVGFVSSTYRKIDTCQKQIDLLNTAITFNRDRLEAIESGAFKMDAGGLIFDEDRLNGNGFEGIKEGVRFS